MDLLSVQDLVAAKKTQRDKDWPMIRRLVERVYFDLAAAPEDNIVEFLLRELRTPELLQQLVQRYPAQSARISAERPALQTTEPEALRTALRSEEDAEREADRLYWAPLKRELEQLRRSRKET